MDNMNFEALLLSIFGDSGNPVSGQEIIDLDDLNGIRGMVFLPTGDGILFKDDEPAKKKGAK